MTGFSGKTILITGAAGGIGRALATHFGAAGGRIAALDINHAVVAFAETLSKDGIEAAGAVADIASHEAVEEAFSQLHAAVGPVDLLINNAGFSSASNLEATTPASWQADIAGNLNGAYHCSMLAIQDMKQAAAAPLSRSARSTVWPPLATRPTAPPRPV